MFIMKVCIICIYQLYNLNNKLVTDIYNFLNNTIYKKYKTYLGFYEKPSSELQSDFIGHGIHCTTNPLPSDTTYDSALTWACTLGNEEIVKLLLDYQADVEHHTKDGCTALMFASLTGHKAVCMFVCMFVFLFICYLNCVLVHIV